MALLCTPSALSLFTSLKLYPYQFGDRRGVYLEKFHSDHRLSIGFKIKSVPVGQFYKHTAFKLALYRHTTYHQRFLDESLTSMERLQSADYVMDVDHHHDSSAFT